MSQRPVTLADVSCLAREPGHRRVSTGSTSTAGFRPCQTSGQVAGWLGWRGFPIASLAALGKISQGFRARSAGTRTATTSRGCSSARATGSWR